MLSEVLQCSVKRGPAPHTGPPKVLGEAEEMRYVLRSTQRLGLLCSLKNWLGFP